MTHLLKTERTIIDTITLDDAEFIVALVNTPGWLRFIGNPDVSDVNDAKKYLKSGFLRCYRENGYGYYLIRALDHRPIGICGFLKKEHLEYADFGFALHDDWYGRGLGLESAEAVLNYGIEHYQFTVLDAVTSPLNVRSKRLLSKLGFIQQGSISQPGCNEESDLFRWRI